MANRLELGEIVGPSEQGSTAGEDGFFDDFKAVPAFEAAVVFTFGRFTLSFFSASPSASCLSSPEGESNFPGASPSMRSWSWASPIFSLLAPQRSLIRVSIF
jgi:hypothetical protein